MLEILQSAGLSERESRVYASALKLGKGSIEKISKEAGLQRTTAYNHVESLIKKGLISTTNENKRTYYVAESPEHLLQYISKQKQDLDDSEATVKKQLPSLLTEYNQDGSKPVARLFTGIDGVRTMREEVLKMEGKVLLVATDLDKFLDVFPDETERNNFTKRRKRRKIKTRMLYTSANPPEPGKYAPEEVRRVDEKKFPFSFDIYIYDSTVAIASLEKNNIWGVIIEGKAVADSMKTLFEMSWSFAS